MGTLKVKRQESQITEKFWEPEHQTALKQNRQNMLRSPMPEGGEP